VFVQIIEFRTDKIDEGQKHVDEYRAKTEGKRTARRGILAKDRDQDDRYFNLVFFDSYEDAMQNSKLPETQELSEKLMSIGKGEPTFYNLDIVNDQE
jgi:hypothetical protein